LFVSGVFRHLNQMIIITVLNFRTCLNESICLFEPLPVVKTEIRAVYGALSGRLFWFLAV